jgi:signal transduction histidine kinase
VVGENGLGDRLEDTTRLSVVLVPLGFLAGVVWARLRRSNASNLVVELRAGGVETLRDRLAQALGDPTLEIAYWLEQTGTYADAAGHPCALPDGRTRAVTHVLAGGAPVAALIHDPALLEERDLVESVRATAGLVLENERLAAEVRAQLEEVRASRARIVAATDEERRRLERDLHDGAQQRLVALSLRLALAQADADAAAGATLDHAREDVERALAELREFARGVHPSVLREDGLDSAVETLARRSPLPVEIIGTARGRLPDPIELAAYFFVSEALTNVARHARATYATVTIAREHGKLTVTVADDGIGGADTSGGSGLGGLADRLAALDGTLTVHSEPGAGTKCVATIPCDS